MAVNSTSSTAMAPMTSFARRDSVGTGTGGRMATSDLLQSSGGQRWFRAPFLSGQRSGEHRVPRRPRRAAFRTSSAAGGGPSLLEVRQGGQCVVQAGDLRQRKAGVGRSLGLRAVVGGDQEEVGAEVFGGHNLQRDATDGAALPGRIDGAGP